MIRTIITVVLAILLAIFFIHVIGWVFSIAIRIAVFLVLASIIFGQPPRSYIRQPQSPRAENPAPGI